jgi:hypothetical protein
VDADAVRSGLRSFPGVAHRLEEVIERAGVLYVNDSKATNVASTLVALDAFADASAIHLILGGQAKDQDFTPLRGAVQRNCRAVYLIGQDAPAIADALKDVGVPLHDCGDLSRAVAAAAKAAAPGEVVLLSPACASFDEFADFAERELFASSPPNEGSGRRRRSNDRMSEPPSAGPHRRGSGSEERRQTRRASTAPPASARRSTASLTATLCLLAFGAVRCTARSSATTLLRDTATAAAIWSGMWS